MDSPVAAQLRSCCIRYDDHSERRFRVLLRRHESRSGWVAKMEREGKETHPCLKPAPMPRGARRLEGYVIQKSGCTARLSGIVRGGGDIRRRTQEVGCDRRWADGAIQKW